MLRQIKSLLHNIYSYVKNIIGFETIAANKLDELSIIITDINERIKKMALNLDALTMEVSRAQTVQSSAIALLQKLTSELEDISAKLASKPAEEPVDTKPLDDLVTKLKSSTDSLSAAIADSADVQKTHEVVLNADNPDLPTVKVTLPEVLPETVKVEAEQVVDKVDTTSPEPQVEITVKPADEVHEDAVTSTIETPEGQTDVTVSAPADVHEEIKTDTGVDVVDAVKEAVQATPEVVAAPEAQTETPTDGAPA